MADDVQITVGVALDNLASGINQARSSIDTLKTGFQGLAAAIGVTLLADFIGKLTELAEQAERTAVVLGISAVAAQQLNAVGAIFGGSAQSLTVALERLQLNLQRGQQLTSQQAHALQTLGLTAQQVASVPIPEQVNLFADAVKRLNDQGINPANALLPLFGRGVTTLIPYLAQGSAGIEAWNQRLRDSGAIITNEANARLVEMGHELTLLGLALKGLSETLLDTFGGALLSVVKYIEDFVGQLSLINQAVGLGTYLTGYFSRWLDLLTAEMNKDKDATEKAQKALADYNAETEKAIVRIKEVIEIQGKAGAKTSAPVPQGPNRDAIAAAQTEFQETIALLKEYRDAYLGTENDLTVMVKQAAQERMEAEIKAGQSVIVAKAKYDLEVQKADTALTKKIMTEWKSVADTIAGAFNSQLTAILDGTESFGAGMKKAFASMVEDMIKSLIKLFTEWLTLNAISLAMGGGPLPFSAVIPTIGKFAEGTPYVPSTGMALIHQGEAIIPANLNPFGPTLGGGAETTNNFGSSNVSLSISAIDGRSVANMFFNNRGVMQQIINMLARNNPSNASRLAGVV